MSFIARSIHWWTSLASLCPAKSARNFGRHLSRPRKVPPSSCCWSAVYLATTLSVWVVFQCYGSLVHILHGCVNPFYEFPLTTVVFLYTRM